MAAKKAKIPIITQGSESVDSKLGTPGEICGSLLSYPGLSCTQAIYLSPDG